MRVLRLKVAKLFPLCSESIYAGVYRVVIAVPNEKSKQADFGEAVFILRSYYPEVLSANARRKACSALRRSDYATQTIIEFATRRASSLGMLNTRSNRIFARGQQSEKGLVLLQRTEYAIV